MTQRDESDFLKPSGERPSGKTRRRVDLSEGMATPSPPGDSASRARARPLKPGYRWCPCGCGRQFNTKYDR